MAERLRLDEIPSDVLLDMRKKWLKCLDYFDQWNDWDGCALCNWIRYDVGAKSHWECCAVCPLYELYPVEGRKMPYCRNKAAKSALHKGILDLDKTKWKQTVRYFIGTLEAILKERGKKIEA